MYCAIQLKQCVSNYSHWELVFSHFSTGKKEKGFLNFIVMNKPVSPFCNSLAPCMQARSGPTHEKQQAGTPFMLLLFNLLFHLKTKSWQLMWKPQKHEPRAKVSKNCQPLAKLDTWLWKQRPAQTSYKDRKTGHGRQRGRPTSQKIPQGSLSECNNVWTCSNLTWLECTWMEFILWEKDKKEALGWDRQQMKLGQKELMRQWAGTGQSREVRKQQHSTRCGQKKWPEFSLSHSPVMESNVPQMWSL